jgi:hypothetical protein
MHRALLATTTSDVQSWWDTIPSGAKWAALAVAVGLLVLGLVKKVLVLTLLAGLAAGALLAAAWWTSRH